MPLAGRSGDFCPFTTCRVFGSPARRPGRLRRPLAHRSPGGSLAPVGHGTQLTRTMSATRIGKSNGQGLGPTEVLAIALVVSGVGGCQLASQCWPTQAASLDRWPVTSSIPPQWRRGRRDPGFDFVDLLWGDSPFAKHAEVKRSLQGYQWNSVIGRSPVHKRGSLGAGFPACFGVRLVHAVPCVMPPFHKPAVSQPGHRGASGPVAEQAQYRRVLCSKALSAMKGYGPPSSDEAKRMPRRLRACSRPAQTPEWAPEGPEPASTVFPRSSVTGPTVGSQASRSVLSRLPDVVQRPRLQRLSLKPPESPTDDWLSGLPQWSTPAGVGSSLGSSLGSELGTRTGSGLGMTIRSVSGVSSPIRISFQPGVPLSSG